MTLQDKFIRKSGEPFRGLNGVSLQIGTQSEVLRNEDNPASTEGEDTVKFRETDFTLLATAHSDVSSFCRAVLSKLIPEDFWGFSTDGLNNRNIVMKNVDQFVRLRKYETLSLHRVFQGIKVNLSSSQRAQKHS